MNLSRRRWLGSSAILLGSQLLDTLTTPLCRWTGSPVLQAVKSPHPEAPSHVTFVDVAKEAGLNTVNVWGGVKHKKYIIEAKGSGLAFFDYDQDGWLDIYLTNGDRLPGQDPHPGGKTPTQHLFKNNRDGTFTDVTEGSGLGRTGWGTGVCVGDYNNDGWDDLFCTYWGHNILWRNNGEGTFTDVTREAGLWEGRVRWGSGCTWLDYNRDGFLDLFVCNYIDLDIEKVPAPGQTGFCRWKGIPTLCGPRGLPGGTNILYRNNGNGTFTDVSGKAGILKPGPRYSITAVSYDFDNDGWPDIYVAVDSEPSIFFRNKRDGTFEDVAVMAGCAYNDEGQEQAGMGVAVGDYDRDGWLDIFKTNFSDDTPNLYHNSGDGTFTDSSFLSGLGVNTQYVGWGVGFVLYQKFGLEQGISRACNCSDANYNALQAVVNKRFSHGYTISSSFTWSKSLDYEIAGFAWSDQSVDPYDRKASYGPGTDQNRGKVWILTHVWQLPYGQGLPWGNNARGLRKFALAGWQFNGTTIVESGFYLSPQLSNQSTLNADWGQRPDRVPGVPLYPAHKTKDEWYNVAAFQIPQFPGQAVQCCRFGNASRGSIVGPGEFMTQWAFWKEFRFASVLNRENTLFQIRWENYNFFNHPVLGNPDMVIDSSLAGKITSLGGLGGGEGYVPPRRMQFTVRLQF